MANGLLTGTCAVGSRNIAPRHRKDALFERLASEVAACRACPRMAFVPAVLSRHNGDISADIMFVAEAPGRLGASRSGIPLCGDQSGRNFERLIGSIGLSRDDVFITNAVLCNPLDQRGLNAPPSLSEVRNCRTFLERTLAIVDPLIVVTLGSVALKALAGISPHDLILRDHVARPVAWNDRILVPLYHPSPRAQLHRSFDQQMRDISVLEGLLADLRHS